MAPAFPTPKLLYLSLMIVSILAVSVADVCLKRAAVHGSMTGALASPWAWTAVGLYVLQFVLLVLIFVNGWKLSVVGIIQTVLYAVVTLGAGVLLFDEALSLRQTLGLALAAGSVVLLAL